jgi:hypothetical protein
MNLDEEPEEDFSMPHPQSPPQAPSNDPTPEAAPWPLARACPLCGGSVLPFDVRLSALLDWIAVLEETAKDVRRAAEALVA